MQMNRKDSLPTVCGLLQTNINSTQETLTDAPTHSVSSAPTLTLRPLVGCRSESFCWEIVAKRLADVLGTTIKTERGEERERAMEREIEYGGRGWWKGGGVKVMRGAKTETESRPKSRPRL